MNKASDKISMVTEEVFAKKLADTLFPIQRKVKIDGKQVVGYAFGMPIVSDPEVPKGTIRISRYGKL